MIGNRWKCRWREEEEENTQIFQKRWLKNNWNSLTSTKAAKRKHSCVFTRVFLLYVTVVKFKNIEHARKTLWAIDIRLQRILYYCKNWAHILLCVCACDKREISLCVGCCCCAHQKFNFPCQFVGYGKGETKNIE